MDETGRQATPDKQATRLDLAMRLVGVSARQLAEASGLSNSIISRWRKGSRPLTIRSTAVFELADALLALDGSDRLADLLLPHRNIGEEPRQTLVNYLVSPDLPALPARVEPPLIPFSGDYITQQQVFLGESGFRRAVLVMLDYLMSLPPGQQVTICAHNSFELLLDNVPFVLRFLQKMANALKRQTTFLLVNRRGFGMEDDAHFARFWLVAHLRGIIRSRYYDSPPPEELFVISIPGYWSAEVRMDPTAEDGLISVMYSDPRNIRQAELHCQAYVNASQPASQYGFLANPAGDADNRQGWQHGPLPGWLSTRPVAPGESPGQTSPPEPDGCFSAICRVPSIGIMSSSEFQAALMRHEQPDIPDYLFPPDPGFSAGEHKIIMCRDDIIEGLTKSRSRNEPLSLLLNRRAYLAQPTLVAMLRRLLAAMEQNEAFEVALLPRSAFAKLELEIICWQGSVSVGWLQDGSQSVLANDPITSGSFHVAIGHAWSRLLRGWKRKSTVTRTIRKWLAGKGLEGVAPDSAIVQNWHILPRE